MVLGWECCCMGIGDVVMVWCWMWSNNYYICFCFGGWKFCCLWSFVILFVDEGVRVEKGCCVVGVGNCCWWDSDVCVVRGVLFLFVIVELFGIVVVTFGICLDCEVSCLGNYVGWRGAVLFNCCLGSFWEIFFVNWLWM